LLIDCFGETLTLTLGGLRKSCAFLLVLSLGCSLQAQTYKVGSAAGATPQTKADQPAASPGQALGFGSNIENARWRVRPSWL
jgi:hypothetical protein